MSAKKAVATGIMLVGLVIMGTVAVYATTADHTIVPGEGIGPVHLGMTLDFATAAWGSPSSSRANSTVTVYCWFVCTGVTITHGGPSVFVSNRSGSIVGLGVLNDDSYTTIEGVRTGWPESAVRTALGDPEHVEAKAEGWCTGCTAWVYQRGLAVVFNPYDVVYQIIVMSRNPY
jgi:hypothetical protein